MKSTRILRTLCLGVSSLMLLPLVALPQSPAGNRTNSARRRPAGSNSGDSQSRQTARGVGPRALFISGRVVQDDGTPAGDGIVIERICNGRTRKEAYADSKGDFSFQVGARNNIMPDASDDVPQINGQLDGTPARSFMGAMGADQNVGVDLTGCELRARLPGFRSSVITLEGLRSLGQVDVGTLVLRSIEKVPGTTISVTTMQAPKDARKALLRAQEELRKQRLEEAERDLHKAVDSFPRFAAAWFELGNLHQRERRFADARGDYMKAVEADRNFVKPYIELGRIATFEQKWAEAAGQTDKAIALDPIDFPEGYLLNSLANYSQEKMDEAEKSAIKARRLDGIHRYPLVHIILAGIYESRKDGPAAVNQLRDYLKYAPATANTDQIRAHIEKLESPSSSSAGNLPELK